MNPATPTTGSEMNLDATNIGGHRAVRTLPVVARYVVAAGCVALAWAGRAMLSPAIGPIAIPFIFFFPAVVVAAWYGGAPSGTVAIALSSLAADWAFLPPVGSLSIAEPNDRIALIAFVFSAGFIVAAMESMHRARARRDRELVERRRSEMALAESRDLVSTTLASIGDGVIVTDAQGLVTFVNRQAEALTGWPGDEAKGQPLSSVLPIFSEDTGEPLENLAEKVLRLGASVGLANHSFLLSRNGSRIPIDDSAAPIRGGDGRIHGVVHVFRDVRAQRDADHTRARLAAIVDSSGDVILTKDLNGIIRTWNASAEKLFGYAAEEIIGKPITTLIPPDRLHEEDEILERLRQGKASERLETIRMTKDGRRIPVVVNVSPIRDSTSRIIGASKILHDISDVIAAREALAREHELLETTLASIGDGVIVTDRSGRITFLNKEAQRLTRWPQPEAEGRDLTEVFRIVSELTRERVENPVEKVVRIGTVVGLANHTVLIDRDGMEHPIDDSAAPIRLSDGTFSGVVLVFRDVTVRRNAERVLQESDRRKDEFLAVLSHELRNPLAPIRMAVSMLRTIGSPDQDARALRDIIDRQTRQLVRLLDDLLDVSRITSGKISLRKDWMDLRVAVASAVEVVRPHIDAHGQNLVLQVPEEPIRLEADLGRLSQVFANMLNNASKYTDRGGCITLTVKRVGQEAVLCIQDTGIGIETDQLSRVFEMFMQVEPAERGRGGLGVGLALAKTLTELHEGWIEARSAGLGRGSEFIVHLPAPARSGGALADDAPPEPESPERTRLRVLIGDDNADSARVLTAALRHAGHDVITAHDGPASVTAAASFKPDVALLDIGMPGLTGYEVAERLRRQRGDRIVLVAITGWGQEEDKRRAMRAGFDHHFIKPVDLSTIQRLLDELPRP
jgi:PAS domain S-box-containing protein